jgi:hypothetical protein
MLGRQAGKRNLPHSFEMCPQCGKKGVIERISRRDVTMREKHCRYCHFASAPFLPPVSKEEAAKELARLYEALDELDSFLTAFCRKWQIPVNGRAPEPPDAPSNLRPEEERKRLLTL